MIWVWIAIGYVAFQLALVVGFFALSRRLDRRYKARTTDIPEGYVATKEVHLDPVTNRRQRVYYHPPTGDRLYIEEKS
ncbi:hypothetical protein MO973_18545 [Paenibacillus sp. TRM 82003]|nr:hypothetical protein [Paenibacillus sp. TRM 82003]